MKLTDYTVRLDGEGLRVKCDAQARFTVKSGRKTLEDRLTSNQTLGGAYTVACIMYNGLSMSGGASWQHPSDGRPIKRPHVLIRFRPQDVLHGAEECDCPEHRSVAA